MQSPLKYLLLGKRGKWKQWFGNIYPSKVSSAVLMKGLTFSPQGQFKLDKHACETERK